MIDILFPAWNRLHFTRMALACLLDNTDWSRVGKLWLYDDCSEDGTAECLKQFQMSTAPVECYFSRSQKFGGPVAIMNDFFDRTKAEIIAKVDNDTCVPAGWLNVLEATMIETPALDLLGMEALDDLPLQRHGSELIYSHKPPLDSVQRITTPGAPRTYRAQNHIGGIGLMRTRVFHNNRPKASGRFGFTAWQEKHDAVAKGFLTPRLPVCLLDRVPIQPWTSLSHGYIAAGWQRDWGPYDEDMSFLWDWFDPASVGAACA